MSQPAPRTGQCPNCGATIEFKIGASRATVCSYCQAVVARKGQDFEAIGQVADLIPTGSRIALGATGRYEGTGFEVVGRVQYEWQSGVWDEWYIALRDGRWGWLAEAQGRFYVTFRAGPRKVPTRGVTPGASVFFEGLGRFVCTDVKQAAIVGIAGELPEPVTLGEKPLTADLESENGAFATIDYGMAGHEPTLFVGRQVPWEALALHGESAAPTRGPRPTGDKLKCPNCGAPLTVRLPEQSQRVTCLSCQSLLDTTQGALQVIEAVAKGKTEPRIPLGATGTLRGHKLMVVGWMVRSCVVDGIRYPWDEYLLYEDASQSFLWLVESDGHWQLATPISAAKVHLGANAEYEGKSFRHFSSVEGSVERVLGEFYWQIQTGDSAQLDDFIRPPEGLSCERADHEVNWTHLEHLERKEVSEAFGAVRVLQGLESGVGAIQPWPWEHAWQKLSSAMLFGVGALFVLLLVFAMRPTSTVYEHSFSVGELHTDPGPDLSGADPSEGKTHSFLSSPFELSAGQALEVRFSSNVDQSWSYASGAIIDDATGESAPFGLESSSYHGYEGGESWSEGSRTATQTLRAPGSGKAVLRADLQWEPGKPPPDMRIEVATDSFSFWQFLFCLFALLWPMILLFGKASFEKARWENSNLVGGGDDE